MAGEDSGRGDAINYMGKEFVELHFSLLQYLSNGYNVWET